VCIVAFLVGWFAGMLAANEIVNIMRSATYGDVSSSLLRFIVATVSGLAGSGIYGLVTGLALYGILQEPRPRTLKWF